MIVKTTQELGSAWLNAKANLDHELRIKKGENFGMGLTYSEIYAEQESAWASLHGSRLSVNIGYRTPHVEFVDQQQLTMFVLRWS